MSDDLERLRDAFLSLADRSRSSESCPPAEMVWDGATGRLTARRTRRLVDHLATCPACAEAWRLAREAAEGTEQQPDARPRGSWAGWLGGAVAVAAAAVVLVVVAPVARDWWRTRSAADVYRGDTSEIKALTAEQPPLRREHAVLRWTSPGDGARYVVRISMADLTPLTTAGDLRVSEYIIPASSLANVPSGSTIFWQVDATLRDGRTVTSPTFLARIE